MTLASSHSVVLRGADEISRAVGDSALPDRVRAVLRAILEILPELKASLGTGGVFQPQQMCLEASQLGRVLLQEQGLQFEILGGDIVLGPGEALEHYVLLHRDGTQAVVVDLTASQLPWLAGSEAVVAIAADARAAVSDVLSREWHWYLPQQTAAITPPAKRAHPEPPAPASFAGSGQGHEAAIDDAVPDAVADFELGALLHLCGRSKEPEDALRRADAAGSADAAVILGLLLNARGEVQEAEAAFRRADERGDPEAAAFVGTLLLKQGNLHEAEAMLRRGDARGSGRAAFALAAPLHDQGDPKGAEDALSRADARGHADAATLWVSSSRVEANSRRRGPPSRAVAAVGAPRTSEPGQV